MTAALALLLLPLAVECGTGDTSIWDVWSSSPDEYAFNSQQQRNQLEGRLRFAALKGDIEGWEAVLARGKLLIPPLNINAGDLTNDRSALHFIAQEGYGGDMMDNSTRVWPPADDKGLFGDPSFTWGFEEYSQTFLYKAYVASTQYPEGIPEGAPDGYVFDLDWCNEQGNTCPMLLDLDARDKAGTHALMEAAIHNNPLTLRTLIEMSAGADAPPGGLNPTGTRAWEQDEFVRNINLDIEWGIGWALYNWISLNARDWVGSEVAMDNADQFLRDAMSAVADNPKLGLTVLDYAVLWDRAAIVRFLVSRQPGLVTAESNWGERPIHKAGFMGHVDVAKELIKSAADCGLLEAQAMGLETPVMLASLGGHIEILEYFKATCPGQFNSLIVQSASTELAWQSQNPCDLATYSISKAREWCGDDYGCPGYYRWRCSNDHMKPCIYKEDCMRGDEEGTCDESPQRDGMPFDDLNHWWQTCVVICPAPRRVTACGASFDGSSYDGFSGR